MDCTECKNYVSPYVDNELGHDTVNEVEQHLSDCEDCETLVQAEKRIKTLLSDSYHPEKAPFSLRAGIRQQLAKQNEKPGWYRVLITKPVALLATSIVMLVMVSLVYQIYHSDKIAEQLADNYKVQLRGQLDCINCYLSRTENMEYFCLEYGHYFGLITDTKEIFSFISNDLSRELQEHIEYALNEIEITGWLFHKANFIEIEEYRVVGKTMALAE